MIPNEANDFLVSVMITDHLRREIEERAQAADSQQQIGDIIFHTLSDNGIAWRQVDRDGIKQLVVDAVRAFRSAHQDRGGHPRVMQPRATHHVAV